MPRNYKPHPLQCSNCGSWMVSRGSNAVCDECKEIRQRKFKHQEKRCKMDTYIVVSDPDTKYGYKPNALFTREEVRWMLNPCNCSFTLGTILRNKKGEFFIVARKQQGGQLLRSISGISYSCDPQL